MNVPFVPFWTTCIDPVILTQSKQQQEFSNDKNANWLWVCSNTDDMHFIHAS